MSTPAAQALWSYRPNLLHPLHTHDLTHQHQHTDSQVPAHTCSQQLQAGHPSIYKTTNPMMETATRMQNLFISPNQVNLSSVELAQVSAWELPCRSQSPMLLQTHSHRKIMSTAGQWRVQINNHSTVENCSVQPIIQSTMLCQGQCGRERLSLHSVLLGSAVWTHVEKSSLKIAQTRNWYRTWEKTLEMFIHSPILGGL